MRITAIQRLLDATSNIDGGLSRANQNQVQRIKDRLNQGVDVDGNAFAPYKDPSRYKAPRPLSKAAHLFDGAELSIESKGSSKEATSTIIGMAARIAFFQNVYRQFMGNSTEDKRAAMRDIAESIKDGVRKWR